MIGLARCIPVFLRGFQTSAKYAGKLCEMGKRAALMAATGC